MNTLFLKKIHAIFIKIFMALCFITASCHTSEKIIDNVCKKLSLNTHKSSCQTAAYLSRSTLKATLSNYSHQLNAIGESYINNLLESVLKKELDLSNNYYVFYHGQKRQFILPQDIYIGLYEIKHKKLLQNFILLRVLNKNLEKFKDVNSFLDCQIKNGTINKWYFDCIPEIRNHLLCVNPSLFSNQYQYDECSFYYFIHSNSCYSPNNLNFIKDIFINFNYEKHFQSYSSTLTELNSLLSDYEESKTGALIQIFISKKISDQIAYKCKRYGLLCNGSTSASSKDLEEYKKTIVDDKSYDSTQFRLLINKIILDPNSDIKMFRYCNEATKNMKTYNKTLNELFQNMKKSING